MLQVKRKQTQATQLNPNEKIPKLDLSHVWFGDESGSSHLGRWEQRAKTEEHERPPPPLTRRLTPMSELLESLLETETSSRPANNETKSNLPTSTLTFTEETPPPRITRNLTPMSNLLESLLKVKLWLTAPLIKENVEICRVLVTHLAFNFNSLGLLSDRQLSATWSENYCS